MKGGVRAEKLEICEICEIKSGGEQMSTKLMWLKFLTAASSVHATSPQR